MQLTIDYWILKSWKLQSISIWNLQSKIFNLLTRNLQPATCNLQPATCTSFTILRMSSQGVSEILLIWHVVVWYFYRYFHNPQILRVSNYDELVKSQKAPVIVIPVKTGIQENQLLMDAPFRGSDGLGDFLRDHQLLGKVWIRITNNDSTT